MITIKIRKWDFEYADEYLGGEYVVRASGYPIIGYDIEQYSFDECIEKYVLDNNITDTIQVWDECKECFVED